MPLASLLACVVSCLGAAGFVGFGTDWIIIPPFAILVCSRDEILGRSILHITVMSIMVAAVIAALCCEAR